MHTISLIVFTLFARSTICQDEHHSASWNFSKWWDERTENTQFYNEPIVFDEPDKSAVQYGDFDRFHHIQYKPYNPYPDGVSITSTMLEVAQPFSPVTSIESLNNTIRAFFSAPRHWSDDKDYMRDLRESIKEKFLNYGLKTAFHVFKTDENHHKMVRQ